MYNFEILDTTGSAFTAPNHCYWLDLIVVQGFENDPSLKMLHIRALYWATELSSETEMLKISSAVFSTTLEELWRTMNARHCSHVECAGVCQARQKSD